MTDPLLEHGDGQTPLTPDDLVGLKPTWVRTRADLDEAEQANIARALAAIRVPPIDRILDDLWLRRLHERMFGDVWAWAGTYRQQVPNLGANPRRIPIDVRNLCEDAKVWCGHESPTVVGARFHHALVATHPFPNGNGRHARAAADLLVRT